MIIENYYAVIDTETGGLYPEYTPKGKTKSEQNPICEIAFVILDKNFNEVERYQEIIKPYGSNPVYAPQALAVHGITMNEIKAGIDITKATSDIDSIFSKYSKGRGGKVFLVGHNIKFDHNMLQYAWKYCGKDLHKHSDESLLCTMMMARLQWGHDDSMENFKLGTCCDRINVNIADAHRALADVLSTAKLLEHLVMTSRNSSSGGGTLEDKDEYERIDFKF